MTSGRGQKGMVLLLVLFVVALLATLLSEFAFSTLVDLRLAETFRDSTRAYYLARGGTTVGRMLLKLDTNNWDAPRHPEELWAQGLAGYPVGDGFITLYAEDLNGKLNLNLVASGANSNPVHAGRFQALCEVVGVDDPVGLTDSLIDWLDSAANDPPQPEGAEADYYRNLSPPYPIKDGPLETMEELALIKGFTPENLEKLAPFVTIYGDANDDKVNVNSASKQVLTAVFAGIGLIPGPPLVSLKDAEDAANSVFEMASEAPITDQAGLNQLKTLSSMQNLGQAVNLFLAVKSNYFAIHSEAEVNDGYRTALAIINKRNDKLLRLKVD